MSSFSTKVMLQNSFCSTPILIEHLWMAASEKKSNNQRSQVILLFHITLSTFLVLKVQFGYFVKFYFCIEDVDKQICFLEDFVILFCPMRIMFHVSLCLMHICVDKFHRIMILDFMVRVGQQLDSSSCERWFKINRAAAFITFLSFFLGHGYFFFKIRQLV